MSGTGDPRDYSGEFEKIFGEAFAADPAFGESCTALLDQALPDDSRMVALLRRSSFLTDFMAVYGAVDDVPGYSHCAVLRAAEGFSEDDIPTEEAAIAKPDSSVNGFIDHMLQTAVELGTVREAIGEETYETDCSTVKLAFASDAWFHYEEACPWLLRMLDVVITDGVETATMSQTDVDTEAYLYVGRLPSDQEQYSALASQIYERFTEICGEDFRACFEDVEDIVELQSVLVQWGVDQAVMVYEENQEDRLSSQAMRYLQRIHERDAVLTGERLDTLSDANGLQPKELVQRLRPFYDVVLSVAQIGITAYNVEDEDSLPPVYKEVIAKWLTPDEQDEI